MYITENGIYICLKYFSTFQSEWPDSSLLNLAALVSLTLLISKTWNDCPKRLKFREPRWLLNSCNKLSRPLIFEKSQALYLFMAGDKQVIPRLWSTESLMKSCLWSHICDQCPIPIWESKFVITFMFYFLLLSCHIIPKWLTASPTFVFSGNQGRQTAKWGPEVLSVWSITPNWLWLILFSSLKGDPRCILVVKLDFLFWWLSFHVHKVKWTDLEGWQL